MNDTSFSRLMIITTILIIIAGIFYFYSKFENEIPRQNFNFSKVIPNDTLVSDPNSEPAQQSGALFAAAAIVLLIIICTYGVLRSFNKSRRL